MSDWAICLDNLSYTYAGRAQATLNGCDLKVAKGEFVLLAGPTGCGKSTLLKAVNGLIPHYCDGRLQGNVQVGGLDTRCSLMADLSQKVGLVFQNPDDQLFATTVEDETAFGPENLALPKKEIARRVKNALFEVGLKENTCCGPQQLSGGQKQRLAIAAVLSMAPEILLLDEPFAQLDPQGVREVLKVIKRLNHDGMTVVMAEHRLHEMARTANRLVVMEKGRIVADGPVRKIFSREELFRRLGLRVPESVRFSWLQGFTSVALTPGEVRRRLNGRPLRQTVLDKKSWGGRKSAAKKRSGRAGLIPSNLLELDRICFSYTPKGEDIIKSVSLKIRPGEMVALMGRNGCGKSTLLWLCAGLLHPASGNLTVAGRPYKRVKPWKTPGRTGIVFQNSTLMLVNETVEAELGYGPRAIGIKGRELDARLKMVSRQLGIVDLRADNPLALSSGQRLRVAVGSVLTMQPPLILLDEPTSGQDGQHAKSLLDYLRQQTHMGSGVIFSTHDVEAALTHATRLVILETGRIAADGDPHALVRQTGLLRRSHLRVPEAVLIKRVLDRLEALKQTQSGATACSA